MESIARLKQKEFEQWIAHWKQLQHPLVPGEETKFNNHLTITTCGKIYKGMEFLRVE